MSEPAYIVAQLGARMHYAVPRILYEAGQLERLYTDICAVHGWPQLLNLLPHSLRPPAVNRLLSRVPRGIPAARLTAFNDFGYEYAKRRNSTTHEGRFVAHLWAGEEFCHRIVSRGLGGAGGVFTFNSAGLELLRHAKRSGLRAITEQTIAPMRLELKILDKEAKRFPGWEAASDYTGAIAYCDREEAEWGSADLILCGSEFVRDGIARCGGPVEKCLVVPYGVEGQREKAESGKRKAESSKQKLRVLTVGTVGLRKGSPYVLEAAKQLKGKAMFRMVGSIGVTPEAATQLREHLELTGPVPRSEIAEFFAWADVFLLPSLCEGSATVIYEALASGLPVICTPNTGSVVRDGVDGFIVPPQDSAAIAEKIERLAQNKELHSQMAANAKGRAVEFTVTAYGKRLLATLATKGQIKGALFA